MTRSDQAVFVIDDDSSIRTAIKRLLEVVGFSVMTFASGQEFLESVLPDVAGCVILDVRLPGYSGLALQAKMAERGVRFPIVFITGHGDIPMSVQAMKAGAVEFLTKPFRDQDLLDAVEEAIKRDRVARRRRFEIATLRGRYDLLTPREREVMGLVVIGLLNKQIAKELGASEKTIKVHRSQVMHKMQAESFAELVRMADKLEINSYHR
jgi:FixJ family two-component response regulator